MSEDVAGPKLRALLATMDFPPTRGGIQTMAREIATRSAGVSFRVIAPADRGHEIADAALGLTVRRARRVLPGRRGFAPAIAAATIAEARRSRPEVALAMHVLAAPGALLAKVPTVVVTHGGELRSPRIAQVARMVLPRAAWVVANSSYTRTAAIALGADPLRTTVLPVGAPDPVDVPAGEVDALRTRLGGGRIVLSVGRLAPHKGQDRLIEVLPDLPQDVRLVLVGQGPAHEALVSLARERGVEHRVIFAGGIADDALPVYLRAADAFALLSRSMHGADAGVEGGGIALLEACAYGLPVIAAATGGIPETIRDAETGLLVDPEDGSAVVRVLRRILEDRSLSERLARAGELMATGERSWTKFVERMDQILVRAARPSGRSPG